MHAFEQSEELEMIVDTVRRYAGEQAGPKALERDEHRRFDREAFDGIAELGLLGLPVGESAGGVGLGLLAFAAAVETLAGACGSTARILVGHGGSCAVTLEGLAAAKQLCAELCGGERLAAFVGPEHRVQAGDGGELRGAAGFVTGGMAADRLIVAAVLPDRRPALFELDPAAAQREAVPALGFRAAAPARLRFDGASGNLLGAGDEAAAALRRGQLATWIGDGALAVGLARSSIELSRRHARERVAFGKPLLGQQAVAHKLVESLRRAEAARHLVWQAARLADAGATAAAEQAAMLGRIESIDAAVLAADEGIQIHGGYGYTVEYHVERHYRDALALAVLDGDREWLRDRLAERIAAAD